MLIDLDADDIPEKAPLKAISHDVNGGEGQMSIGTFGLLCILGLHVEMDMVMVFCFRVLRLGHAGSGDDDATPMGLCGSLQVPKSLTWSEASIMRSWLHRARDSLQAEQTVVEEVSPCSSAAFVWSPRINKDREVFTRMWNKLGLFLNSQLIRLYPNYIQLFCMAQGL